jgi:Lar family restriction alleviation protein
MRSDIKLKNCPFCGSTPELLTPHDKNHAYIECSQCCARSDWAVTSEKAAELWNIRIKKEKK